MAWLKSEVFDQEDDAEVERVDEEQHQHDKEFNKDLEDFRRGKNRRRAEAVAVYRSLGNPEANE